VRLTTPPSRKTNGYESEKATARHTYLRRKEKRLKDLKKKDHGTYYPYTDQEHLKCWLKEKEELEDLN
jgi:hypothetical protein